MSKKIENPYPQIRYGSLESTRISVDIPEDDSRIVRKATLDMGALVNITKLFIKHISHECRKQQWIDNPDEFYNYVRGLVGDVEIIGTNVDGTPVLAGIGVLFHTGPTQVRPNGERPVGDDGRGTAQLHPVSESQANQPTARKRKQAATKNSQVDGSGSVDESKGQTQG